MSLKFLFFMLLFLLNSGLNSYECGQMANIAGECLEFSMKYKGAQSATSVMSTELHHSVFNATWEIDTKTVFSWLFKIHNTYQSEFSLDLCRTLKSHKSINQKNIQQTLSIQYDWEKLMAISSADSVWQIPSQGCYDLLSMIYRLRTVESGQIDLTQFIVDIEGQIWNVITSFLGEEQPENNVGIESAEKIELTFTAFGKRSKRKWKTDLLSNRMSKPNAKLLVWLGPFPQRLPVAMQFGTDESSVEMNLQKFTQNNKR